MSIAAERAPSVDPIPGAPERRFRLRRYLPRALFARSLLIVVVPMVAPRWNVVGRVVAPIADSVAGAYLSIADRIA